MTDTSDFRELLLDYKLKTLSAEERERFDEQMLGHREFSDRLAEAEYDLLDDYRSGRLTPAQALRVKRAFSPQELKGGPVSAKQVSTKSVRATRAGMRLALPAVAGSILAVAAGLLTFHFYKHGSSSLANTQRTPALAQNPAPAPQNAAAPPGESSKNPVQTSGAVATLLLDPSIARGAGASVLDLGHAVKAVRVQWIVPPAISGRTFSLSVTHSGSVLATVSQRRGFQRAGRSRFAEFDLDAGIFAQYPENTRFLLIVYQDGAHRTAVAENPVILRKENS